MSSSEAQPAYSFPEPLATIHSEVMLGPIRGWFINNGSYESENSLPDRFRVKDILYAYANFQPDIARRAVDADLVLYAMELTQPDLFSGRDEQFTKAIRKEVTEAARTCSFFAESESMGTLKDLANQYGVNDSAAMQVVNELFSSGYVDRDQRVNLEAVIRYLALKQTHHQGVLPKPSQ